jgi:pantothenate synthetase
VLFQVSVSPRDGPVTYPGHIKTLIKSSKGRKGQTLLTVYVDKIKNDGKDEAYDTYGTERHADRVILRSREKIPLGNPRHRL